MSEQQLGAILISSVINEMIRVHKLLPLMTANHVSNILIKMLHEDDR